MTKTLEDRLRMSVEHAMKKHNWRYVVRCLLAKAVQIKLANADFESVPEKSITSEFVDEARATFIQMLEAQKAAMVSANNETSDVDTRQLNFFSPASNTPSTQSKPRQGTKPDGAC